MTIYTDGSAHPNPGPGGFGVVVLDDNENILLKYSKQTKETTTNNREEIKAILYSFLNYGVNINNPLYGFDGKEVPTVYSDSNYCVQTFNSWMFSWAKNGWIKSDKNIPENLDLIQAYYDWYMKGYRINLVKVRGHSGNKYNELADGLATGRIPVREIPIPKKPPKY